MFKLEFSMEPFAMVEDVQRRLDFLLDDREETAVNAALEDMSNEARYHARRDWPLPETAPYMVRTIVLKAVARWAQNMHGYVESRAGDEILQWTDLGREAGMPAFLPAEVKMLRALGDGRMGDYFGSVELYAYADPAAAVPDDGWRPVPFGLKPFPMYDMNEW